MPKYPTKTVRNKSPVRQSVTHDGMDVHLDPYAEKLMATEVADKFLDIHQGLVIEVEADFGAEFQDVEVGKVWIANRTGDPDAPDKVTASLYDTKLRRWQNAEVDNPVKAPRDLQEWAEGAMKEVTGKDGVPEGLNMPGHWVEVPAYRRRQFDKMEADWFMNRISNAARATNIPTHNCAAAIVSRPPSTFEPDMTWSLNEMRAYLRLCDPDAKLGPTEEQIEKEYRESGEPEFEWVRNLDDAKRTAMKRVYFRLIDPRYKLPTRAQFNEFMAAATKAKKSTSDEQPAATA